mgnify:CR=1 FL=1
MKKKIKGIWLFGYSSSGKTFASKIISKKIKKKIILDGDEIRRYVSTDLNYIKKDRITQTKRILGFAIIAIKQNLFPIISTSYLSKKVADFAKKKDIKVVEITREKSKLFKKITNKKNVVGKDIFYENFLREKIHNDKNFKRKITIFIKKLNF